MTLAEVLKVAQDLHRARLAIHGDWDARKRDIGGALSENTWTDRARVLTLGPLSMVEHLANRAGGATTIALLRPALALALRSLKGQPEAATFGQELATDVADAFIRNLKSQSNGVDIAYLSYAHKFYCGTGLLCERRGDTVSFTYSHCEDGWPSTPVQTFTSREAFVAWLAQHSDLSLSGVVGDPPYLDWKNMGNQRLTQARLLDYIQPN